VFKKILIANRGEIACRVASTAKRLGINTVAVYSEADADSMHVAACDQAILIGPAPAKDSYLVADKIIAAALASGAQAIHPGYGFLSENSEFAQACTAAGLTFIGPPVSAIRAMGSKSAAKTLMEQAKVPLVPGYHGENQAPDFLLQQADRIGYPVLLKASAGGGGKGMRVVESAAEFKVALASCQREALASFQSDQILIEKYLQQPRHIEIQIFADGLGNCVHLFERDCSVQRRHQKVLEEAPAPGMTDERRNAMGAAAVAAAKAVGYVGAGTVEFIVDQNGSFYFMEMNTRLQVEHPVTEMITGVNLVEWQLRVASGEPLPLQQQQLSHHGHAIEARVYAENPDKGFLPSIGTLVHLRTPEAVHFEIDANPDPAAIRIDSGVKTGDTISPYYDPMIAKLIVWGKDRNQALANMAQALSQYQLVGVSSNLSFLQRLVTSQAFTSAKLDTSLIESHHAELFPAPPTLTLPMLALAVVQLTLAEDQTSETDPWSSHHGWRMNSHLVRNLCFEYADATYNVSVRYLANGWHITKTNEEAPVYLIEHINNDFNIQVGAQQVVGTVVRLQDSVHIFSQGQHIELTYADPLVHAGELETDAGRLTAPMPGKIVALLVARGQSVKKGESLLIMEAMKMEHNIAAPADGVVKDLMYSVGDQVVDGAQLLEFE